MTAPEVAAMLESLFRVRGGTVDFRTLGLAPRPFLGQPGYQFDFEHLDGDEVWRRGRAVGATVNGRLYLDPLRRRAGALLRRRAGRFRGDRDLGAARALGEARPDRAGAGGAARRARAGLRRASPGGVPGGGGRLAIRRSAKSGWARGRSPASWRGDVDVGRRRRGFAGRFARLAGLGGSAGSDGKGGNSSGRGIVGHGKRSFASPTAARRQKLRARGVRRDEVARRRIPCYSPRTSKSVRAGVAELVDALVLGTSIARCGGSSPFARTMLPRLHRRS